MSTEEVATAGVTVAMVVFEAVRVWVVVGLCVESVATVGMTYESVTAMKS